MDAEDALGPDPGDLLLAALALAPFAVDYSQNLFDFAALPQAVFTGAAAAATGAWYALSASRSESSLVLKFTPWHALLGACLLWCGLSGLWARSTWEWWQAWRHWLAAGAAGAVTAAAGRPPARWALAALFASACAQAMLCAGQYFTVPGCGAIPQLVPPGGTFGHRSFAMEWLALGAPFGAALWAREERPSRLWALALGLGLVAGVAALASARAAWLALAAEALLLAVWLARERGLPGPSSARRASAAGGIALALLLAAAARGEYGRRYGTASERLSSILLGLSGAPLSRRDLPPSSIPVNNARMRLAIWRNALAAADGHAWRGVGLGNFGVEYPWFSHAVVDDGLTGGRYMVDHAHNDLVELYVETGLVGLVLGLSLLSAALAAALRAQGSPDAGRRAWAAACGTALAGIAIDAQFVFPAHKALPPMTAAVMAGLLAGSAGGRPTRLPRRAAAAAGWALAALVACALQAGARRLAADLHFGRVQALLLAQERGAGGGSPDASRAIRDELTAAEALAPQPRYEQSLAASLGQQGRWDEALTLLQPYVRTHPNDPVGLSDAALVLTVKGRGPEALAAASRAVRIRTDAQTLDALGLAQRSVGLNAAAALSFARAEADDPKDASLPLREWAAWLAAGDRRAGAAALQRARSLDPGLAARAVEQVRKESQGRTHGG